MSRLRFSVDSRCPGCGELVRGAGCSDGSPTAEARAELTKAVLALHRRMGCSVAPRVELDEPDETEGEQLELWSGA